jgi:hypothetical protein
VSDSTAARRADGSSPVRLDVETFEIFCELRGLSTVQQRMDALDLSMAQYYRIVGGAPVGAKTIDSCLRAFGGRVYERLFVRVDQDEPAEVS